MRNQAILGAEMRKSIILGAEMRKSIILGAEINHRFCGVRKLAAFLRNTDICGKIIVFVRNS